MTLKSFRTISALTIAILALASCASFPHLPGDRNLLTDVTSPGVSREAVLMKLGEPSSSFESGRILTYRIGEDADGYFLMDRMVRWSNTKYSVVFVFDSNGHLQKYKMIPVR
ncbi:hypothetical protein GMLC_23640 [Geomonas limicola]|uniref:Lipoprotein SmpA/OmlA domain-containing protein n=1 Tax=Geomonas limicola TaxID=2740186 RepID=A0A6V8N881_9BACT|nr:hypothetical protein [Geomonas limicola]GFO68785.1 hypothetical protein GMLC_23640 [Geomonas limicola]